MKEQAFTTLDLPTGLKAVLYEGYGRHYFRALRLAQGDTTQLMKCLLILLLQIEGKNLTEEDVDNMHIRDINFAAEALMAMLSNGVPGLPGY